jgi:hypothetical protein
MTLPAMVVTRKTLMTWKVKYRSKERNWFLLKEMHPSMMARPVRIGGSKFMMPTSAPGCKSSMSDWKSTEWLHHESMKGNDLRRESCEREGEREGRVGD